MNNILKSYDKYKECNLPGLKEIPIHWNVIRNKYIFSETNNKSESGEETLLSVSQYTGITRKKDRKLSGKGLLTNAESLVGYKIVEKNNLVMNIMLAWNGSLGISKYEGIVSPAYCIFEVEENYNPWYFHYLLRTDLMTGLFKTRSTGVIESRLRLYPDSFYQLYSIVPPKEEQDQIVKYLDSKIFKIDKLIKVKKKEIELLKEQKLAVVNNAVTKGLNQNVKMKSSGVEWLGDIPETWAIIPLRQLLSSVSIKNRPDLPLLSVVREKGVIIRDVDNKEENHNFIPDDLSGYKVVKKGQFVMNKMKAWQGSYGVSKYEGIVSPAYYIFDLNFDNIDYFHYAIRSKVYVNFFAQSSDGIRVGQWDLSLQKMKEIPFIIPTKEEQKEIVEYIPKVFKSIEKAIEDIEQEIKLVEEYKTALISNIVTGKLDVRNISVDIDNNEIKNY